MGEPRRVCRRLLVLGVLLLAAGLATLPFIGRFLYVEDPLQRADAILVLAGTFADRPLEAADLHHDGFGPIIVLTREMPDGAQQALARRGLRMPDRADLGHDLLLRLGVPEDAIVVLGDSHDSTADEARSFRDLISARRWHRVIVVTSKMHTRRARMAMVRTCKGLGVEFVMRASRYDRTDPAHWWRHRSDVRSVVFEAQKYVLYWLGVT